MPYCIYTIYGMSIQKRMEEVEEGSGWTPKGATVSIDSRSLSPTRPLGPSDPSVQAARGTMIFWNS